MHARYDDITSRIDTPPLWFDEHAVPRYCAFSPTQSASIYIAEIALAEIACQCCKRLLQVALSRVNVQGQTIAEAIRNKTLHYGDPPWHCGGGESMNSEPRRVIEYWRRNDPQYVEGNRVVDMAYFEWVRDPSLEVDISRSS